MPEPSRGSYAFGPFVLDASKRLLLRNRQPVPLAPKVLDTLLALIEDRQHVISKEQLLNRVWGDTVIEEGGLARNISLLRKSLGEKPDDHRYIVTVPARGYRFVAEVREVPADTHSQQPPVVPRPNSRKIWRAIVLGSLLLGAAATALVWRSASSERLRSDQLGGARLIRLTSTSGLNTDPALSPDGMLVAYASDRAGTGNLDIWVQPVRGGPPTRVTSAEGDEVEPSFSPDGSSLAFSGGEAGGIYIVGALGGEPRLLVRGTRTRTPRFSPDGQSILYWVGQTAWVNVPDRAVPGASGTLAVVPSSGGTRRAVAADFSTARYGVWSPDGRKILFLGARGADPGQSLDWYVTDPEGGTAVRTGAFEALRVAGVVGAPVPGAWTAEGVVFTTTDEATSNVWRLPISAHSGRVAGSAIRLTFGAALERSAAVSAAGHIAFTTLTENVDVWRIPLDPRTGTGSGEPERVTDDAARDTMMNVSADGRTLAFVSSRTGRNEVWLKDHQTGAERQLTYSGSDAARISADGSRVAVQQQAGARQGVELYDASGGQSSRLCDDCRLHGGGWSSDSSRLLISRGALERPVILDVNSRREIELTAHPQWNIFQPRFSPDDRWVVFHTTNAPDLRQVYAVPVFLDTPVPVKDWVGIASDFGIYPTWSADGTGVYHFSLRDGHMGAWLQQVDPRSKRPIGAPRPVHHFHRPRLRAAARATPSNDVIRGALFVTLTETVGNIWLLDPTRR
jgi:Tol biopolymer transport system component/DNA-binding winged helix-turn-helix (wHTH) protein